MRHRTVVIVVFDGVQGLDEAGLLDGRSATTHWAFAELLANIADHPDADLTVPALADHAALSQRSFQRLCTREIGVSPGRYVEQARIDTARRLLEHTDDGLAGIARRCGFATVETFHRAFRRQVGITPHRLPTPLHHTPDIRGRHSPQGGRVEVGLERSVGGSGARAVGVRCPWRGSAPGEFEWHGAAQGGRS